ncbi:hypothetical protein DERP_008876 [Dermatophagoides pteronyssinus]|uniref:Uncharacterized protein n=1 Tax=Dermatophagoides pteronyssinus TaxID=6956 RepID=A0ABQ8JN43_DERPT|nr:hypothetical protein DERP_008876 [Dermatophagoides pteronyssinus]
MITNRKFSFRKDKNCKEFKSLFNDHNDDDFIIQKHHSMTKLIGDSKMFFLRPENKNKIKHKQNT